MRISEKKKKKNKRVEVCARGILNAVDNILLNLDNRQILFHEFQNIISKDRMKRKTRSVSSTYTDEISHLRKVPFD